MAQIILTFIIVVMLAAMQQAMISWRHQGSNDEYWSKLFHTAGFFIRIMLHTVLLVSFWESMDWFQHILLQFSFLFITWTYWDMIHALIMDKDLLYTDEKGINGWMIKTFGLWILLFKFIPLVPAFFLINEFSMDIWEAVGYFIMCLVILAIVLAGAKTIRKKDHEKS